MSVASKDNCSKHVTVIDDGSMLLNANQVSEAAVQVAMQFCDPNASKKGITKDMFDDCMVPFKIPCSPPAPTPAPPARRRSISSDSENSSEETLNPLQAVMGRIDKVPTKRRKFTLVSNQARGPEIQAICTLRQSTVKAGQNCSHRSGPQNQGL